MMVRGVIDNRTVGDLSLIIGFNSSVCSDIIQFLDR